MERDDWLWPLLKETVSKNLGGVYALLSKREKNSKERQIKL